MEETWTIWVCQCCMLMHANGEWCPDDEHGGDGIEPWTLFSGGGNVAMGAVQEEHSCGRQDDTYFGECDCETDTYSTRQCEGCGSRLHGERHAFTLWSK